MSAQLLPTPAVSRSGARRRVAVVAMALLAGSVPWMDTGASNPSGGVAAAAAPRPAPVPAAPAPRGLPPRPNIVLVTADDMRPDDLRAMNFTRTMLAGKGVRFTDALSPYSLCCPARAEIVSGRHSHNNGVRGNKWPNGGYWALKNHRNTLPVWLQDAGYRTGFVGKYMNGYATEVPTNALRKAGRRRYEVPPGWNHWYASVERIYSYTSVVLRVKTPTVDRKKVEKNEYQTKVFSDLSDRMIDNFHDSGDPFFVWYSSATPHGTVGRDGGPPIPQPKFADRFDDRPKLPTNPTFRKALNEDTSDKAGPMHDLPRRNEKKLKRYSENRLESLISLDRSVERIWNKLKATGELRDTVIIFTSDNGYGLGAHRRSGKDLPYDAMLGVPMIVYAPGLKQRYQPDAGMNEMVRSPLTVTTLDIPTTITAVSGATTPWAMEGVDMMRPAQNPDLGAGDRGVLIESGSDAKRRTKVDKFVGVRTDRWTWFGWDAKRVKPDGAPARLIFNARDRFSNRVGWREFYDRGTTPSQVNNIFGEGRFPRVSKRLARMVQDKYDCKGRACVWNARTWQDP